MPSSNTDAGSSDSSQQSAVGNRATLTPSTTMDPKLLMAASHGHYELLRLLLSSSEPTAVQEHPTSCSPASQADVVVEIEHAAAAATSSASLLRGVTPNGDSALHVISAAGDGGDRYLKCAEVVCGGEARRHLLAARNKGLSTPLHCAARAGHVEMLSLLIRLAGEEEGGDERVTALVRMQNEIGETALHEAIRAGDMAAVRELMAADEGLARVPAENGASPLFLAVALRRYDMARELYVTDNQLSYSGPGGQNALHAAVLRSEEMTELLLEWNKQLITQPDEHGNTPLHFALSLETETYEMLPRYAVPVRRKGKSVATLLNITEPPLELTKQLLEADEYAAYQPDRKGSFPIHIAASAGRLSAVIILVVRYSGCVGLRDSHGRTFLHVAVKNKRYDVVSYVCQTPALLWILNKQDNDGNTALHLAVEVGDWWIFARLFVNKQIDLNLPNNERHTPRELSITSIPIGLYCLLNSRILIHEALTSANATRDIFRWNDDMENEHNPQSEAEIEKKGSEIVSNSTQFLSVGLVLITTMAFGATFALPGGYRADDHPYGGTPTLAQSKQFQGFMMANTLAFFCSSFAVLSLVFAGTPTVELPMRYAHYNISIWLSLNAIGSLAIAFVLAVYIMITPVAAKTSLAAIVVIVSVGTIHSPSITEKFSILLLVLCIKLGILPVLRSSISKVMLLMCWPLIVIFGWQEFASRFK